MFIRGWFFAAAVKLGRAMTALRKDSRLTILRRDVAIEMPAERARRVKMSG
jgi:hypothetical protein